MKILHKIYDGALYFQFKMSLKYQGEIDFKSLYRNIFVILYTNAVWLSILFIFLHLHLKASAIQNRGAFGIIFAAIYFVIFTFLEKHLKKIGFVEEVYEKYKSFSDTEKKQKAKKGLYYNVIPLCVICV